MLQPTLTGFPLSLLSGSSSYFFFLYLRSTARIGTLLEQLQKLCLAGSEAKYEQEKVDVEQLRYVTNKIQQLLSSQGNEAEYVYQGYWIHIFLKNTAFLITEVFCASICLQRKV